MFNFKSLFLFVGVVFLFCSQATANSRRPEPNSKVWQNYFNRWQEIEFSANPVPHYTGQKEGKTSYIFRSVQLETSVVGFAGPVDLIIIVSPARRIEKILIESSQETPAYLAKVKDWLINFKGKPLTDFSGPDSEVDTLTHATYTAQAVSETVADSAQIILEEFWQEGVTRDRPRQKTTGQAAAVTFLFFSLAGIILFHKNGSKKVRFVFLLCLVLIIGFGFKLQLSLSYVLNFLNRGFLPLVYPALAALVFVPLFLGFFYGRIYCGWLCPFGALQELLAYLSRVIFRFLNFPFKEKALQAGQKDLIEVSKKKEKIFAKIKYIFLGVFFLLFFLGKNGGVFIYDPLVKAFSFGSFLSLESFLLWFALLGSLFFIRFWCRYFCILGAFLSLLNKIAFFKFVFKKKFRFCPWKADRPRDLSCLLCNKCQNF